MSYGRIGCGVTGVSSRAGPARAGGGARRQLRPDGWLQLEDRTLLASLSDVLNVYDGSVQAIAGNATSINAAIDGPKNPFAATPSLVGDNLCTLLGIGDLFVHPFQSPWVSSRARPRRSPGARQSATSRRTISPSSIHRRPPRRSRARAYAPDFSGIWASTLNR